MSFNNEHAVLKDLLHCNADSGTKKPDVYKLCARFRAKAWRQIVAIIHERTKRTLGGRGVISNVRSWFELKMAILLINFCTFIGKTINNIQCFYLSFSVCLYANFYMTIFHITFFWGQHPAGSRLF